MGLETYLDASGHIWIERRGQCRTSMCSMRFTSKFWNVILSSARRSLLPVREKYEIVGVI